MNCPICNHPADEHSEIHAGCLHHSGGSYCPCVTTRGEFDAYAVICCENCGHAKAEHGVSGCGHYGCRCRVSKHAVHDAELPVKDTRTRDTLFEIILFEMDFPGVPHNLARMIEMVIRELLRQEQARGEQGGDLLSLLWVMLEKERDLTMKIRSMRVETPQELEQELIQVAAAVMACLECIERNREQSK